MGYVDVYNVKDYGALGDDYTDDTISIQNALDEILRNILNDPLGRGGAVYFPPGIYLISNTLKIPPRCKIFGESGGFTQSQSVYPNFYKAQSTVIKIVNTAFCNALEFYPTELYPNGDPIFITAESVAIENLIFHGNKENHVGNQFPYYGIYINDVDDSVLESLKPASGLVLRDVMVFGFTGSGIYIGNNQREIKLFNVFSMKNDNHGIEIKGRDVSLNTVWAGENNEAGFYFNYGGAVKCVDCDSWANKFGVVLENVMSCQIFRLQVDNNIQNGVAINNSHDISFVSCVFRLNSRILPSTPAQWSGLYSEVLLQPNPSGYGPLGINFLGCQFGMWDGPTPIGYTKQAIEDTSITIRRIVFIGCSFKQLHYNNLKIADNQVFSLYEFLGCTSGNDGQKQFTNPIEYKNISYLINPNGPVQYQIVQNTKYITAEPVVGEIEITLPPLTEVDFGKEYTVVRQIGYYNVTVYSYGSDVINLNCSQVILDRDFMSMKFVKSLISESTVQWVAF